MEYTQRGLPQRTTRCTTVYFIQAFLCFIVYTNRQRLFRVDNSFSLFYSGLHNRLHRVHASWRRGAVVSGVRRMNEDNARRARLVPGWVTVVGWVYHLGM